MSKKSEIQQKWQDKIQKNTLQKLMEGDKTPTTKYLDFMCKMWYDTRKKNPRPESSSKLIEWVKKFDEVLPYLDNKDIYSPKYSQWSALVTHVSNAYETKLEKEFKREEHVDVLLENDDYLLVRPKTHRGSLKYGANTKWCTASKYNATTFSNYSRTGFLVYLIRKNPRQNKWDKVAFFLRTIGNGPLLNSVDVFCAEDTSHTSNSLAKSDWTVIEILHFQNLIRSIAVKEWRVAQSNRSVKDFVKKLHELDVEKTLSELVILKEGPGKEYDKLVQDFRQSVEKFTEKIKLSI